LPALQELAAMQGPEAEAALAAQLEQVQAYLPAAVSAVAAP
jgi:hypothetical protein